MATYDITTSVDQNKQQMSRRVELPYRIDFSKINGGAGLAADESAKFAKLPAGFVHERLDPVGRTAQGAAATFDVGIESNVDGLGDGLNANGSANSSIALAGNEAIGAGHYFHTDTDIVVAVPTGGATIDAAVVDLTFVGYMRETDR